MKCLLCKSIYKLSKYNIEVNIWLGDVNLQERIAREAVGERVGDVHVGVLRAPVPRLHRAGENFVGHVALILQLGAHVMVEHAGERAEDRFAAGIVFHAGRQPVAHEAQHTITWPNIQCSTWL